MVKRQVEVADGFISIGDSVYYVDNTRIWEAVILPKNNSYSDYCIRLKRDNDNFLSGNISRPNIQKKCFIDKRRANMYLKLSRDSK